MLQGTLLFVKPNTRARIGLFRKADAMPYRHGGLRQLALLGAGTHRTWARGPLNAGPIRQAAAICEAVTRPTM
jgi:hypothetical protein